MENVNLINKIYNEFYIETNLKNILKYFDVKWEYINNINSPKIPSAIKKDPFLKSQDYINTLGKDIIQNGTYCPYIIDHTNSISYGAHRLASLQYYKFNEKIFCIKMNKKQTLLKNFLNDYKQPNQTLSNILYELKLNEYDFKINDNIYCWISDKFMPCYLHAETNKIKEVFNSEIGCFFKVKIEYDIEMILYLHLLYDSIRNYIFYYHDKDNKILPSKFLNNELYYYEYIKNNI